MNSVPEELGGRPVLVLDPMLATGGSLEHACRTLFERGAGELTAVCVLAAPEGVARIDASGLVAHVVTASLDERLDDSAYIVPGLGDAGDRVFGTACVFVLARLRRAAARFPPVAGLPPATGGPGAAHRKGGGEG